MKTAECKQWGKWKITVYLILVLFLGLSIGNASFIIMTEKTKAITFGV
jgi:hypothetical protein